MAKRRTGSLFVLLLALLLAASPAGARIQPQPGDGPEAAAAGEFECLLWNIVREWFLGAAGGYYGYLTIESQSEGQLRGTLRSAANGETTQVTGTLRGHALELETADGGKLQGKVCRNTGQRMSGDGNDRIFGGAGNDVLRGWAAIPVKEDPPPTVCLQQVPLPERHGEVKVTSGPNNFIAPYWTDLDLSVHTGPEDRGPSQAGRSFRRRLVLQIVNPGPVPLVVDVRLRGPNLPASLTVFRQLGREPRTVLGTLKQISKTGNTARYRGRFVVPRPPLAPGVFQTTRVLLENPFDKTRPPMLITNVIGFLRDPAGNIYNTVSSDLIPEATCTLYKKEGGDWLRWPAEEFGQQNPIGSDENGHYAWLTDNGDFRVRAVKEGYTDGWGGPVTVPPEVTDLHIGLTPTTAPAPEVGHLWLADDHAYAATEFDAGQEVQARVTVSNTTESDMRAAVRWTTTDPRGQNVPELSGSAGYALPPFPVDLLFTGVVPAGSPMGRYTMGVEVEYGNQTRYAGTQFWVAGEEWIYLPLVPFNYG